MKVKGAFSGFNVVSPLFLQCPTTEVQAESLRAEGRQADQASDFYEHGFQSAL